MKMIHFVRILRNKGMKWGYAVDVAGKTWGGFSTDWTDSKILKDGQLGPVGLCFYCRGRVFSGWTCHNEKEGAVRDLHNECVLMPPQEKIFVVDMSDEDFEELLHKFIRKSNFTCPDAS